MPPPGTLSGDARTTVAGIACCDRHQLTEGPAAVL
jgi:hypothetical protein